MGYSGDYALNSVVIPVNYAGAETVWAKSIPRGVVEQKRGEPTSFAGLDQQYLRHEQRERIEKLFRLHSNFAERLGPNIPQRTALYLQFCKVRFLRITDIRVDRSIGYYGLSTSFSRVDHQGQDLGKTDLGKFRKRGFDIRNSLCNSMSMPSGFQPQTYADPKDNGGFAEPVTPSDTMRLLTAYMRTDILSLVQYAVRHLYDTMDQSPIYSVVMALNEVLKVTVEKTPDYTLTRNQYHVVEGHRFDVLADYDHDLRLIAHHLHYLELIISEIEENMR